MKEELYFVHSITHPPHSVSHKQTFYLTLPSYERQKTEPRNALIMYFSCIFERTQQQQQNSHSTSAIRSRRLILGGYFSIEFNWHIHSYNMHCTRTYTRTLTHSAIQSFIHSPQHAHSKTFKCKHRTVSSETAT